MRPTSTTTGADGREGGEGGVGVESVVTGCEVERGGGVGVVMSGGVAVTSGSTTTRLDQTVYTPVYIKFRTHQT